jgi:flagellar biosynthetic protein FliP
MTTQTVHAHPHALPSRGRRGWHFVRHYLEMVAAMLAGMFALGWLENLLFPGLSLPTELAVLVMATNMSLGMAAWMRVRRHAWRPIAEMSAAMYLPFAVLLVPFWTGLLDAGALMMWGHVLMLPAMAAVMLLRPAEYAH